MNDPHVEALRFRFEALDPERHDFSNAAPLDVVLGDFGCRLADRRLVARPREHFADADTAREELRPYLDAWEAAVDVLGVNQLRVRFTYTDAAVIDRSPDPPEGGGTVVNVGAAVSSEAALAGTVSIEYWRYPEPAPPHFADTAVVAGLRRRLRGARDDKTWLLPVTYHFLTTLVYLAGGRAQISTTFNISRAVVNRLARLASQHDPELARKVKGTPQSLTAEEIAWLDALLQRIVIRVGEVQGGNPAPAQITLADLPPLPSHRSRRSQ